MHVQERQPGAARRVGDLNAACWLSALLAGVMIVTVYLQL
jgi:hypothetical protein